MFSVIFDMDGTLLDTQRIYIDAWNIVGNEFGIANMGRLMPDVCGMSEHNWKAYLRNRFPTLDIEPFHTKVKDYIAAYGEVRFKAGAEQLLDFLKEKNIKIAIASGSGRELIEHCMNKLGALERFDVVVGGADVKNGKPAPDIFLLAAEKLGIATRTLCGIEVGKNFFTADTLEKILTVLDITPQDLFRINHLKPQEDLVDEIIATVKNISDREKIETIYKIIKSFE